MARDEPVTGWRFEVRAVSDGWQIWDLQRDEAHEQPDLPHSHWWPPTARHRAQAWVSQHQGCTNARLAAREESSGRDVERAR